MQQKLGEISSSELAELNTRFGGYTHTLCGKNLYTYNSALCGLTFAACGGLAGYAKFVRGQNVMWLVGSFIPFVSVMVYNHVKQPAQHISNCYAYLLEKRSASVEFRQGESLFNSNAFVSSPEFKTLRS